MRPVCRYALGPDHLRHRTGQPARRAAPTPTPPAVQTEPPQESPAVTPAPGNTVEPLSAARELTDEELVKEFEEAYEAGKACIELGLDEETAISLELTDLNSGFDFRSDIKKPDNLGLTEKPHMGTRTEGNGKRAQASEPAGGWRSWPG